LGTILWDAVDVLTFGALEKKHNRTKGNNTLIEGPKGLINNATGALGVSTNVLP